MPESPEEIARLSNLRKMNSHYSECHTRPMAAGAGSERGIGPAFRTPSSSTSAFAPSLSADLRKQSSSQEEHDGPRDERHGWCPRWLRHPLLVCVQLVCLVVAAIFLLSPVARDDPASESADLGLFSDTMNLILWCFRHPGTIVLRLCKELRIERFVVTALMTWIIANVNARFRSGSKLAESYENHVSLQVNFITKDPSTGFSELDWVTMTEEPIGHKMFRDMLAKARKQPPALPETCPTLCPLSVRGLASSSKADQMVYQMLKGYASSKLINNLGISHTLSGLPVKVSDVVICLTFERDENVGKNPAGRKMRLLVMSMTDLEYVHQNALRRKEGLSPCLRTKTGTKWAKMRLQQLEELARHMQAQPLTDRQFDSTRCFGLIRLYTPVTWRDYLEDKQGIVFEHSGTAFEEGGAAACDVPERDDKSDRDNSRSTSHDRGAALDGVKSSEGPSQYTTERLVTL